MGGCQRSAVPVCLSLLLLAPWIVGVWTPGQLGGGGVGLGFVLPLVMWQYGHLLPSELVLCEAGLSFGMEWALPERCVLTPQAWWPCQVGSFPSSGFWWGGSGVASALGGGWWKPVGSSLWTRFEWVWQGRPACLVGTLPGLGGVSSPRMPPPVVWIVRIMPGDVLVVQGGLSPQWATVTASSPPPPNLRWSGCAVVSLAPPRLHTRWGCWRPTMCPISGSPWRLRSLQRGRDPVTERCWLCRSHSQVLLCGSVALGGGLPLRGWPAELCIWELVRSLCMLSWRRVSIFLLLAGPRSSRSWAGLQAPLRWRVCTGKGLVGPTFLPGLFSWRELPGPQVGYVWCTSVLAQLALRGCAAPSVSGASGSWPWYGRPDWAEVGMSLPIMFYRGMPWAMSSVALVGRPISMRLLWRRRGCRRPLVTGMGRLVAGALMLAAWCRLVLGRWSRLQSPLRECLCPTFGSWRPWSLPFVLLVRDGPLGSTIICLWRWWAVCSLRQCRGRKRLYIRRAQSCLHKRREVSQSPIGLLCGASDPRRWWGGPSFCVASRKQWFSSSRTFLWRCCLVGWRWLGM